MYKLRNCKSEVFSTTAPGNQRTLEIFIQILFRCCLLANNSSVEGFATIDCNHSRLQKMFPTSSSATIACPYSVRIKNILCVLLGQSKGIEMCS